MPVDLYQPFTNPITRETFRCISSTPEAYTMEWRVQPGGFVPFEHVHVNQDEIFHVERGHGRFKVNGLLGFGTRGDSLTVPRGTRHIAANDAAEDLVCTVEYKPGLDHYVAMQCFAGLTVDGAIDRRGLVSVPKIMYLLRRANAQSLPRPAFASDTVFKLGLNFFYGIGSALGWNDLFIRYTGGGTTTAAVD